MLQVSQDREHLPQFLIRLCAGVGGLVATSQLICGLIQAIVKYYCCNKGASGSSPNSAIRAATGNPNNSPSNQEPNASVDASTIKTAALIPPQDRVKKPSTAGANVVTLQQVERLMQD